MTANKKPPKQESTLQEWADVIEKQAAKAHAAGKVATVKGTELAQDASEMAQGAYAKAKDLTEDVLENETVQKGIAKAKDLTEDGMEAAKGLFSSIKKKFTK